MASFCMDLIVDHCRLSTIQAADKIVVMNGGQIIEVGLTSYH